MVELEDKAYLPVPERGKILLAKSQDIGPVYAQRPAVRSGQRAENLQECGLPRSRSPHDGYDLGPVSMEIYPLEDLQFSE